MTQPRLLTVILNYKTPEMSLEACEAALTAMQGLEGEITLVDNASADGSFEKLTQGVAQNGWGDRVQVLQSGRNGGFGAGNNFGIRAGLRDGSRPDLVYILNSDAFPAPDAIRQLMAALEADPQAGFAGSYIHGPSGEAHMTAFRFPSIASEFEGAVRLGLVSRWLGKYAVPRPLPTATEPVDWLAGASMLMRRDVLDEIGLFDEQYFLYFEETDLCLRAHRAGWRVLYVRASEVAHIGGVSTGMKRWKRVPEYWYDSRLTYFTKNHGQLYALAATAAHISGGVLWRLRRVIQRKDRVEPPKYLRNLALHYLKTRVSPRSASQSAHAGPAPGANTPGKPEEQ
ncbi:MAG TPA: glycosyltransferase family 2 protein, partial [Aliiroseovarius sp.]|nr:glycosyltransferase family 2 protein [Aliiroseovarius sp.]